MSDNERNWLRHVIFNAFKDLDVTMWSYNRVIFRGLSYKCIHGVRKKMEFGFPVHLDDCVDFQINHISALHLLFNRSSIMNGHHSALLMPIYRFQH